MSDEKVAIGIHKSSLLVALELARYSSTLLQCHYFFTLLAIKDGMISYLVGSFRRAVSKKFLFDSRSVQITQELVAPIFEFFQLGVRYSVCDVGYNFLVQIIETNFATIDDSWEIFKEELLPNLLVDPINLQKVTGN